MAADSIREAGVTPGRRDALKESRGTSLGTRPTRPPVLAILVILGILATSALFAGAAKRPDLAGAWKLDRDASDDPGSVMKEARPGSGFGGRAGGPGAGTRSGPGAGRGRGQGGGGWGHGRGEPGDAGLPEATEWFAALDTLEIVDEEPMLTITDAWRRRRLLYTDGRKIEEEHSHGGTTVVRASWKEGHLEVVSSPSTGPKTIETYAVAADGSQLTVTTTIEGGRRPALTFMRIYAPGGSAPGKAPSPGASPTPGPVRPGEDEDQSI
jgi:hypothetical protein